MVDISHRERVVRVKIVYYGPAAGGKTTNLLVLHRRADPRRRGEMVSVNSTQDRTILLDLLPVKTPAFRGYDLRFQVLAVPGQRMYAASRRLLLNGADALVFVANSAADRWEETLESLREMNQNLISHGIDPSSIPVAFQYNKRDLPETTPLEAMDRTLNARRSDSYPAVAIREEGVIETFGAILDRTMTDLTTRYKIGEELKGARSVKDWTDESMRLIFGWQPAPEKPGEEEEPPRTAVRVPVATASQSTSTSATASTPPSAATPSSDPQAAEALVESYADAAANLTTALENLREEREETLKRLEELSAPIDAAEKLLSGVSAELVFQTVLERIGVGLGANMGSLSLIRPDGELETVALMQLDFEPLFKCKDESGESIARSLMDEGEPAIYISGESSPVAEALDLSSGMFTAMVAIPVKTHVRTLGLLCLYLPQEAPAPNENAVPHLARFAQGLALALEAASSVMASDRLERMERATIIGQLAEQALVEIGTPVDHLFTALGEIRRRTDTPQWLLNELVGLGTDFSHTKQLRDGLLAFMAGKRTDQGTTSIDELMDRLCRDLADPLGRAGIELKLERQPDARTVLADSFLLRCALLALIEHSRNYLAGHKGGEIKISGELFEGQIRIAVTDNCAAIREGTGAGAAADYLAWSLDGKAIGARFALVQTVVEHFQGHWQMSMRTGQGNESVLILPAE